jgi:hypothetical protein
VSCGLEVEDWKDWRIRRPVRILDHSGHFDMSGPFQFKKRPWKETDRNNPHFPGPCFMATTATTQHPWPHSPHFNDPRNGIMRQSRANLDQLRSKVPHISEEPEVVPDLHETIQISWNFPQIKSRWIWVGTAKCSSSNCKMFISARNDAKALIHSRIDLTSAKATFSKLTWWYLASYAGTNVSLTPVQKASDYDWKVIKKTSCFPRQWCPFGDKRI